MPDHNKQKQASEPGQTNLKKRQSFKTLFLRAIRLRCPGCGIGKLFTGWFTMNALCPNCGRKHEREPGFFLGSIYYNYGLTSLIVTVLYVSLRFGAGYNSKLCLAIVAAVSVLFPMWFFRYARSLWASFDELWDPRVENNADEIKK